MPIIEVKIEEETPGQRRKGGQPEMRRLRLLRRNTGELEVEIRNVANTEGPDIVLPAQIGPTPAGRAIAIRGRGISGKTTRTLNIKWKAMGLLHISITGGKKTWSFFMKGSDWIASLRTLGVDGPLIPWFL